MMTPIHRVGYSLRGLEVLRYEEDGTTITVRITPLATMEYLSTKSEGGGNLQKRRLPLKWFLKPLLQAHRKNYTEFFFWATYLAAGGGRSRPGNTADPHLNRWPAPAG